ncbi:hypothetical protein ACEV60_15705 [Enterobacter ludwigii]|uniref:hypothetical protein n=1 Tax=Enterobacter TaxID=547 RepID=UPI0032F69162|nr:hypothetical protein [Enterobacter ludwigii]HDR2600029.1 hypothetical protein [Enterobacter ludwigii]
MSGVIIIHNHLLYFVLKKKDSTDLISFSLAEYRGPGFINIVTPEPGVMNAGLPCYGLRYLFMINLCYHATVLTVFAVVNFFIFQEMPSPPTITK